MASLKSSLQTLTHLRGKLTNIFAEDVEGLCAELESLSLLQPKENEDGLRAAKSSVEKAQHILNVFLNGGDPACKILLDHLEKLTPKFPALHFLQSFQNGRQRFVEMLAQLKMENYMKIKLTLGNILEIGQESSQGLKLQNVQDIPWYFLHNIMALNASARNMQLDASNMETEISFTNFANNVKMVMCQFAVPVLLPSLDGLDCTFMIWAMRDIVKKWRPQLLKETQGFMEDNLVNIPLPFFSFVKLENCSLSKSAILNQLLTPGQQHYDYFLHRDMDGGNLPRKISDGLVEMSCFFPAGKETSDVFTDPLAVLNLRGDILSNWTQFTFLTQISSAVFIFADSISETEYQMLSSLHKSSTTYFIILTCPSKIEKGTVKNLYPVLNLNESQIIVKGPRINEAQLVKHMQNIMKDHIFTNPMKLEQMIDKATELGIDVDEKSKECQTAKHQAMEIIKNIQDVVAYKRQTMTLQGDLWKQLAKTEKELCRMKNQGDHDDGEHYRAKLINQRNKLLEEQNQHSPPPDIVTFIDALTNLNSIEKHFFLKWMKILLDSISRTILSELQIEYKTKYNNESVSLAEIKQLDHRISESSLGIEHFLRELGQFYEAESYMVKNNRIRPSERQFCNLPGIAADLLLEGFPLELIDGDASNIPLQWITDVLKEVDKKMKCQCKMRVITVLGVQSTGKSTLLNTMFGLQFPVASGRCTRGGFMTLLKVKENFQKDLGCHFILVIDTEGLKAVELSLLEGSYEHDNELATLVVGLSDITIINMSMENTTEMKDVLQIVVHAFLRMQTVGKKPNCQFVHQNVSDVSAYEKNMRDRKKLSDQLNEMTQIAAKMEKISGKISFSDVMDHDIEKHTWYIPGLWHGVPPMASVNSGYSENINQLKKHLLCLFQNLSTPQMLCDFSKWIESLWKAVKHETFIFNFRNSLVADAYERLSIKYNELQWNFLKEMYNWIIEKENVIQNEAANNLQGNFCNKLKNDLNTKLIREETTMRGSLKKYFEDGTENGSLIERYREEFFTNVKLLRKQQENKLSNRIEQVTQNQTGKKAVQEVQEEFLKIIEEKVTSLLNDYKDNTSKPNAWRVESKFEEMWNDTLSSLNLSSFPRCNIGKEFVVQLKRHFSHSVGTVNEKLLQIQNVRKYENKRFKVENEYLEKNWLQSMLLRVHRSIVLVDIRKECQRFYFTLLHKCAILVKEKVNSKLDYHDTYCQELLELIYKEINQDELILYHTTHKFKLDVYLYILGKTAPMFQKMHDEFIQENDPKLILEKRKAKYFSIFENIFHEKDECQSRANDFCDTCLKPAIAEYVYKNLGTEIVEDILQGEDAKTYCSRKFFQFALLKKLLDDHDFKQYVDYINTYETFVKDWITQCIEDRYNQGTQLECLQNSLLDRIMKGVYKVLNDSKTQQCSDVEDFLKTFCEMVNKDLVISSYDLNVIQFKNTVSVAQFSADIKIFLARTEEQIKQEMKSLGVKSILSKLILNPQDELFSRVFGCGKQCPFCKVPCEAGGKNHTEHSSSVHRPQGIGSYRHSDTIILVHAICSTDVCGNATFQNQDTQWVTHYYKDYRKFYPDWAIQSDPSITASDYWKFVLKEFNDQFAEEYQAKPAAFPADWKHITKQQAMKSLQELYNIT